MLLDCKMTVHPDPQRPGLVPVKPDKAVPHCYLGCLLLTQVILVPSSTCSKFPFIFCGIKLQLSSFRPVDAHSGAGLEVVDDLVNIVRRSYPSDFVHTVQAFTSGYPFRNPFHEP